MDGELTEGDRALLAAEGWREVEGSAGRWRDPYTQDLLPPRDALARVRKDRSEVLDRDACRAMRKAVSDLEVDVLQLDLEAKRVVVWKGDPTAANRAVRDVAEALNALRRKASDAARALAAQRAGAP